MTTDDFLVLGAVSGEEARNRRRTVNYGAVQAALRQWLRRCWPEADEVYADELPPGRPGLRFRLPGWEPVTGDGSEAVLKLELHAESPDFPSLRERALALALRFPEYPPPETAPGGSLVVFGRAELAGELTFAELSGPGFRRATASLESRIALNLVSSRFNAGDRLKAALPEPEPALGLTPATVEQALRRRLLELEIFPEPTVSSGPEEYFAGEQLTVSLTAALAPERPDRRQFRFLLRGISPTADGFTERMHRLYAAFGLLPMPPAAAPLLLAVPEGPLEFTVVEIAGSRWQRAQFPGLATVSTERN